RVCVLAVARQRQPGPLLGARDPVDLLRTGVGVRVHPGRDPPLHDRGGAGVAGEAAGARRPAVTFAPDASGDLRWVADVLWGTDGLARVSDRAETGAGRRRLEHFVVLPSRR